MVWLCSPNIAIGRYGAKALVAGYHGNAIKGLEYQDISRPELRGKNKGKNQALTYNTEDSLVVTDPTTNSALTGLSMGERTGPRVLQWLWSYVAEPVATIDYESGDMRFEGPSQHGNKQV
ncbi:hypothetical protein NPX13_g9052 [Xylaria arbuscula]|uniref:Uncharacterized protein n=1 Tax=Xylaria arbuscula TaxID=114810 RepID=A0A9W8THV2_9PEZI|nr:hypothetical protein NPX13_g9052 [Xylaria arbuscula]